MKWRALALPLPGCVLVTVVWRSGYVAPLLYGVRTWLSAWHIGPASEADPVG